MNFLLPLFLYLLRTIIELNFILFLYRYLLTMIVRITLSQNSGFINDLFLTIYFFYYIFSDFIRLPQLQDFLIFIPQSYYHSICTSKKSKRTITQQITYFRLFVTFQKSLFFKEFRAKMYNYFFQFQFFTIFYFPEKFILFILKFKNGKSSIIHFFYYQNKQKHFEHSYPLINIMILMLLFFCETIMTFQWNIKIFWFGNCIYKLFKKNLSFLVFKNSLFLLYLQQIMTDTKLSQTE